MLLSLVGDFRLPTVVFGTLFYCCFGGLSFADSGSENRDKSSAASDLALDSVAIAPLQLKLHQVDNSAGGIGLGGFVTNDLLKAR